MGISGYYLGILMGDLFYECRGEKYIIVSKQISSNQSTHTKDSLKISDNKRK